MPAAPAAPRVVVESSAPLQTSEAGIDEDFVEALVALFGRVGERSWFSFKYSAGSSTHPVTLTSSDLGDADIWSIAATWPVPHHQISKPVFPLCEACLQGWYLLGFLALSVFFL
jgi:hypothetical protein